METLIACEDDYGAVLETALEAERLVAGAPEGAPWLAGVAEELRLMKQAMAEWRLGRRPAARIPVSAARRIADDYRQRQVIVVAWDGETTHVATYGATAEECRQAAQGGNRVKAALGWPPKACKAAPAKRNLRRDVDGMTAGERKRFEATLARISDPRGPVIVGEPQAKDGRP